MNKVNLDIQNLIGKEHYDELVRLCKKGVDRISELGPSDNDIKLSLKRLDQKFLVTIKMFSMGLVFNLQSTARSPFMAVESAMKEALLKVQKWSATR